MTKIHMRRSNSRHTLCGIRQHWSWREKKPVLGVLNTWKEGEVTCEECIKALRHTEPVVRKIGSKQKIPTYTFPEDLPDTIL